VVQDGHKRLSMSEAPIGEINSHFRSLFPPLYTFHVFFLKSSGVARKLSLSTELIRHCYRIGISKGGHRFSFQIWETS